MIILGILFCDFPYMTSVPIPKFLTISKPKNLVATSLSSRNIHLRHLIVYTTGFCADLTCLEWKSGPKCDESYLKIHFRFHICPESIE
jgi:hypothetical protein